MGRALPLIHIAGRTIARGVPVFVIAECGSSHVGQLDFALEMIDRAADAGADAAKFQMFRVDRLPRLHESARPFELPYDWLPELKERCDDDEIAFLCTAFDADSLCSVDPFVEAHKISSTEACDPGWTQTVISTGKPVLWSEGYKRAPDDPNIVPLVCRPEYPADRRDYLIFVGADGTCDMNDPGGVIPRGVWGVSDHTLDPTLVPLMAVAMGASVIEKHVTLGDRSAGSPDQVVAIDFAAFGAMVVRIREAQDVVGRQSTPYFPRGCRHR